MWRSTLTRGSLLLGLLAALAVALERSGLRADDPPLKKEGKGAEIAPPTEKELADKRMVFMKTALARYTVRVGDRKEAGKVGDPCLRWTNPIGTAPDGVVAVYAYNGGRPDAIAQFFKNGRGQWVNEFTIIPESDVTLMRGDREFWKPTEFVCKFKDLSGAPVPAGKPALRLPQMRALAADFSVVDYFGANQTKQELRLLPQPVYRYAEEGKIVDGACFVFALGTDPECCLLLEAYRDDKGSRYRYALAPMSIFKLEARYKDTSVWSIERRNAAGPKSREYFAGGYTPEPGETFPE
jgi:hypothetical protein